MIEVLRFILGLVELGAVVGAGVFLVYGYGRWWA